MEFLPRHVICVLGCWPDFSSLREIVSKFEGFEFDEDYSQLQPDDRMVCAFEASLDRFFPTVRESDWQAVANHTAVGYVLSPPIAQADAQRISGDALRLIEALFNGGATAVKSESAGLAHGRQHWIDLARRFRLADADGDAHESGASLHTAWVQRPIDDTSDGYLYSVGMHLLGHRDTEISDLLDAQEALQRIDLWGLYLVADKPSRPIEDGDGFRLQSDGPRRIVTYTDCRRYDEDDLFFNPYGYFRLEPEQA